VKIFLFTFLILATLVAPVRAQETPDETTPAAAAAASESSGDFNAAMRLYKQKRYNEAIAEFQKVVNADPGNAAAHYMMGYAHYVLDHHSEALAAFAKAFEANPAFDQRPYFR
jgi:TolA-binding protein